MVFYNNSCIIRSVIHTVTMNHGKKQPVRLSCLKFTDICLANKEVKLRLKCVSEKCTGFSDNKGKKLEFCILKY